MELVFATNNKHKLEEVREILGTSFSILSLNDINCHEDIPETADTLEGNALQKAQYIKEHYGYDCFADDTGLEVEALGGAPGIYSARYAALNTEGDAESHDSEANMRCLLTNLDKASAAAGCEVSRKAQFRTAIALILNGETHLFEGIVKGEIMREKHGADGFGYDPVFQPEGETRTFAEMSCEEKNAISHRGRAVAKLVEFLTH